MVWRSGCAAHARHLHFGDASTYLAPKLLYTHLSQGFPPPTAAATASSTRTPSSPRVMPRTHPPLGGGDLSLRVLPLRGPLREGGMVSTPADRRVSGCPTLG